MLRNKANKGYHKLLVWQKAKDFVKLIYQITDDFPKAEEYGLKGQIRRASVSILLNIVEGYRRRSTKEFLRFLTNFSEASLTEVEACLELSLDLGFLDEKSYELGETKRAELAFLLDSLVKSLLVKVSK